ncbi:NifU N-terminal domain-containing protein [Candidatus Palauibacter sp.]|uniref:NifU N-terminal domain-containing protein n=1 Tax=Candidatus Palauibacter sp. TaxID=3101350 RepID=UPI003B59A225
MPESDIQITIEGTPNPHAAKFVLEHDVPGEGSRSYFDPESAADDRLAARLFEVDGIRALLIVENFITVTKTERLEWPDLLDEIEEAILEALHAPDEL